MARSKKATLKCPNAECRADLLEVGIWQKTDLRLYPAKHEPDAQGRWDFHAVPVDAEMFDTAACGSCGEELPSEIEERMDFHVRPATA